jgi:hypothetical protein
MPDRPIAISATAQIGTSHGMRMKKVEWLIESGV